MRALNVHYIQNASARRGWISHQVLNRPQQNAGVIVGFRQLVQKHRLPAARFPPAEHDDLHSRHALEQFVL